MSEFVKGAESLGILIHADHQTREERIIMGKYDNLLTLARFAEEIGSTYATVLGWVEQDKTEVAIVAGNTKLYERDDLQKAMENKGKVGQTIKAMGYVHPDVFKELETRYFASIAAAAEEKARLIDALAELEGLRTSVGGDMADVVNVLRLENDKLTAELIAANTRIDEQTQAIKDQNAVIVRASVENNEFAKENDALKERVSELEAAYEQACDKNDAMILENVSKSSGDADEKLSDAYAEIQTLKEALAKAKAFSNSIITGESASV